MATVDARITALREFLKSRSAEETVFIVEGGAEYHTKQNPFDYLREHGAFTHDGRRIVLYPHPVEGVDPLSLSLYQMIDEAVELGRLDLPELEGDEPNVRC
jgi:hypothetical protein